MKIESVVYRVLYRNLCNKIAEEIYKGVPTDYSSDNGRELFERIKNKPIRLQLLKGEPVSSTLYLYRRFLDLNADTIRGEVNSHLLKNVLEFLGYGLDEKYERSASRQEGGILEAETRNLLNQFISTHTFDIGQEQAKIDPAYYVSPSINSIQGNPKLGEKELSVFDIKHEPAVNKQTQHQNKTASIEQLENETDLAPFSELEIDLLLALENISCSCLQPRTFSPIESNYIYLLIKSFRDRLRNENGHGYVEAVRVQMDTAFAGLNFHSWETFELIQDRIINRSIVFGQLRKRDHFGFSCSASYKKSPEIMSNFTCYYHFFDRWLTIIQNNYKQTPTETIEFLSFPMNNWDYCLGHKIIYNRNSYELNVQLILLKNAHKPVEENKDFYEEYTITSEKITDLERSFLKYPSHLSSVNPLKNIEMSIFMALPFFHSQPLSIV